MTEEFSGERWPFATNGPPTSDHGRESGENCTAMQIVEAAARATDVDPLGVPTLNDRIDPDGVDALVSDASVDRDGVRIALEVSLGEVTVVLDDVGRIDVYPGCRRPNELVPTETVEQDWAGSNPLYWTIATTVAKASGGQPSEVVERLLERTDGDALDRLLRPLPGGTERVDSRLLLSIDGYEVAVTPDGTIELEPSLAVLKRSGAALLGVGAIPEPCLDRASATLLGTTGVSSPVFVLHGRDLETAERRLSMVDVPPSNGTVLDVPATARSATGAVSGNGDPPTSEAASGDDDRSTPGPSSGDDDRPSQDAADREGQELEVIPVPGGLQALPEAVDGLGGDEASFLPGELRVCVDSLGSMIESTDLQTTREAIEPIRRAIGTHQGIGQFLLPVDPDDESVRTLAPSFDAVVAFRTGDDGIEQRWRLTGTGHETRWFPLR